MKPMLLLEDTRNRPGKHEIKHRWFKKNGIRLERCKLYVGDYTLPTNQSICIDTKQDLQELITDVTKEHERFKRELIRAQEAGIQLVILVEHGYGIDSLDAVRSWKNPRKHQIRWRYNPVTCKREKYVISPKAVDGEQLYKSLQTMIDRYGVQFVFCEKDESGQKIVEILSHDRKRS